MSKDNGRKRPMEPKPDGGKQAVEVLARLGDGKADVGLDLGKELAARAVFLHKQQLAGGRLVAAMGAHNVGMPQRLAHKVLVLPGSMLAHVGDDLDGNLLAAGGVRRKPDLGKGTRAQQLRAAVAHARAARAVAGRLCGGSGGGGVALAAGAEGRQ